MRSDMYKVIVERPRKGKVDKAKADQRRHDFDGPTCLGMRAGIGRPWLNENLNPLRRYLRAQVGRPWNKVYSEISAGIDRRNTVQLHILAHIDDLIAVQVAWRCGELIDLKRNGSWYGGNRRELHQELYVDPRTGLIRPNKAYRSYIARRRAELETEKEDLAKRFRRIDKDTLLMLLGGEWYEVRLTDVPSAKELVFDAVLKQKICAAGERTATLRRALYADGWRKERFAISKRQLSRKEIAEYGLPR